MPALQEAPRPQPTGNIFERGIKAAARSRVGRVIAVGTIAFGADACAPQAREPQAIGTVVVVEPGAIATAQAREVARLRITPTAFPTEVSPTPQPTAEARPTATPIGIGGPDIPKFGLPEIDAIGEKLANEATRPQVSEKDVIRWNAVVRLNKLAEDINAVPASFNPRISQETFASQKKNIELAIQAIKDMLDKGDLEEARGKIISFRRIDEKTTEVKGLLITIGNLSDPAKSKFVPKDLKQKHDPKDKYIQFDSVDPQVYYLYLPLIDIMVGTDPSY